MPRYIYKSAVINIPVRIASYDTDKLVEAIDRKTNDMAEAGWRLMSCILSPQGGTFYLLLFEKPAIDPGTSRESR